MPTMNAFFYLLCLVVGAGCTHSSSNRKVSQRVDFSESCRSCGQVHRYAYSYSGEDYDFFSEAYPKVEAFYWKAPHGPTPACSSRFEDLSYSVLKEELPDLKRETFQSFLRRNEVIAVHLPEKCPVAVSENDGFSVSRPGFDSGKTQALACDGRFWVLFELRNGKWKEIDGFMQWIS